MIYALFVALVLLVVAAATIQCAIDARKSDTYRTPTSTDVAVTVLDFTFDADQQAEWDAHCRDALALVRNDALDHLAAAEADRADWSIPTTWSNA